MSTDAVAPFLGLDIAPLTSDEALAEVARRARAARFSFVVTPNVDHVVRLAREPVDGAFRAAYRAAGLRLCDSRILASLARLCGDRLTVVPGSDLTARLFATVLFAGDRVAVVGGDDALIADLHARFPGPDLVHIDAPMGLARDADARGRVVAAIEDAAATYVLLAVGAPQSEMIAAELTERGKARGVGLCIGASLEFLTGAKIRAPRWMQRSGLEWLHRLSSEPRRLARRYLVEGPRIFVIVARWRLFGRPV
jgi:N-acetylglucosaminyldiphosphoundecaprenol N-acetyl-beta-D-mannosaminyltransferase